MAEKVRILTARPHRLLAPLIEELGQWNRQEKNVVLLVPEQLTLQTEREIFERLHLEGSFYLDILSPSRFYERVLENGGRDQREPLNSAGRRMAVSLALERLEDRLGYYGALSLRTGFVEKTAALITDLKRGGLSPEMLAEYAEQLPAGISREKLGDLALIYAQYEAVLRKKKKRPKTSRKRPFRPAKNKERQSWTRIRDLRSARKNAVSCAARSARWRLCAGCCLGFGT